MRLVYVSQLLYFWISYLPYTNRLNRKPYKLYNVKIHLKEKWVVSIGLKNPLDSDNPRYNPIKRRGTVLGFLNGTYEGFLRASE
ncbi:hypothetical protein DRO55_00545 [Candidatus Bathyarchaeota archaeon]|nr:MAG: hypothetical protein DRO55_00545 [Candidatus Bathyarchaeota archaeon]